MNYYYVMPNPELSQIIQILPVEDAAPPAPYTPDKDPTIIFSVGPNCPVRCEGCYNHFGNTAKIGGLVTANEIVDFANAAKDKGLVQSTVAGGDPLFHPEIVPILRGFKGLGLTVKLDTVGTSFLGDSQIVFKGRGTSPKVSVEDIAPYVDYVNVPLDGASQETVGTFRKGRPDLFNEARTIARLLRTAGVPFGYNTVANTSNIDELAAIRDIAEEDGAAEWQVFEYDPKGPNPTSQRDKLKLAPGQFAVGIQGIESTPGGLKVDLKDLQDRTGAYFLIEDSGHAWKPSGAGLRYVIGHVTRDRERVIAAWQRHIVEMRQPLSAR